MNWAKIVNNSLHYIQYEPEMDSQLWHKDRLPLSLDIYQTDALPSAKKGKLNERSIALIKQE